MKKRKKKEPMRLTSMKVGDWDLEQIRKKADLYAEGNVSEWLRYVGRMYTPKKGERIGRRAVA